MANVIDEKGLRRVNVRNQSGPQRTIMSVEWTPQANLVTNSCGHVERCSAVHMYKVGSEHSCFSCRFADDNVISWESLEPEISARYK